MIVLMTLGYLTCVVVAFKVVKIKVSPATIATASLIGMIMLGGIVITWKMAAPTSKQIVIRRYVLQVAPDVREFVEKVHVNSDQVVEKGDPLFDISSERYQYAVDQASAQLKSAQRHEDDHTVRSSFWAGKFIGCYVVVAAKTPKPEMTHTEASRMLSTCGDVDLPATIRNVLMQYHPRGWLSLTQLAALAGSSVRTLQRRLAEQGASFTDISEEAKIRYAQKELVNSDRSVRNLSNELGYSKRSNFDRAFKRWTGKTPEQFRQVRSDTDEDLA